MTYEEYLSEFKSLTLAIEEISKVQEETSPESPKYAMYQDAIECMERYRERLVFEFLAH